MNLNPWIYGELAFLALVVIVGFYLRARGVRLRRRR